MSPSRTIPAPGVKPKDPSGQAPKAEGLGIEPDHGRNRHSVWNPLSRALHNATAISAIFRRELGRHFRRDPSRAFGRELLSWCHYNGSTPSLQLR